MRLTPTCATPQNNQSALSHDAQSCCFGVSMNQYMHGHVSVYFSSRQHSHGNASHTLLSFCLRVIKYVPFSAFKACHPKIKTFYFAAENVDDMSRWVNEAFIAVLHTPQTFKPILSANWIPLLIDCPLCLKQSSFVSLLVNQLNTHTRTHTLVWDVSLDVELLCVSAVVLPHRWLSRLSMAVAGYSEQQEKMRQDQGEISHSLCSRCCKNFFSCYRSTVI